MVVRRSIAICFAACLSFLFAGESQAGLITFNNDAVGNYANPFTSVDSSLVQFSEVGSGAVGSISVIGTQSTSNVITSALGPGAPDEILIEFLTPVTQFSFETGHPSALQADAWLRVFDGATQVAESRIALDSDTLFNQVMAYSGSAVTSALFAFVDTGSTDLGLAAESLDNFSFSPVPVPAAVWLFGTALIGFVGISRRTRVA